ncbi:TPA: hypothetical protein QCX34_004214 [Bacillus anthracis]|nr:hypothetical protein [Bacillus cereus]KZD29432.1 hypothetical protein B4082_4539 [Bacillus cereus]MBJ8061786.1 hypothetical protein [Bacillus cereus]HDR7436669.1 hypothetical protein [Bacillus anthracis]
MQEELVSVLGDVFGKEILVQQADDDTYANTNMMRVAGVPEAYIPMYVNIQKGIREGGLEVESNDLEKLLGRPTISIKEALNQIVSQSSQT